MRERLLLAVGDDSDMKIAPAAGLGKAVADAGEEAAQEFVAQLQNGNIEKAHRLGIVIADLFFGGDGPAFCKDAADAVCRQRQILFIFLADTVLNQSLPSVLAESASQKFMAALAQKQPDLVEAAGDPKTLSYYLLSVKHGRLQPEKVGKAFALLCGREGDDTLCQTGAGLCEAYQDAVRSLVEKVPFVQ